MQQSVADDTSPPEAGPIGRLLRSAGSLLATFLTIVRTRLELLSVELKLEVRRVAGLLVLAFLTLFAATVGLVFAGIAVILIFWDTHRVLAAIVVTGSFIGIAAIAGLVLAYRMSTKPQFLADTLAELAADSKRLRGSP